MSAIFAESLPVWLLLFGGGIVALGQAISKSARICGRLTLFWIVLAGVSLHPAIASLLVGDNELPEKTASAQPKQDSETVPRGESISSLCNWPIAWQWVILPTAFLVVLMSLGHAIVHHDASDSAARRYSLLLCSTAGLCGCACAQNLWWLFVAGRMSIWPWLLAFREFDSRDRPNGTTGRLLISPAFWRSLILSLPSDPSSMQERPMTDEPPPRSPPLVLLMMREFWSVALTLGGLIILAYWTGLPALSLSDLQNFDPRKEASLGWGIAGVLLVIIGSGWTIPLHFETLDVVERADSIWTVWYIGIQIIASVLTVCGFLVLSTLGRIASAETMLLVLAGWSLVIGSLVTHRQIHLRRWLAGLVLAQSGWWMTSVALVVHRQKMGDFHPLSRGMYPENLSVTIYLVIADLASIVGFVAVCRYLTDSDRELNYLDDLRGALRQQPGGTICAGICLLSILGLPLTAGFWSRWQLMAGFWNAQLIQPGSGFPAVHGGFLTLACVLIFSQGVMILAVSQPLRLMFIERPISRIQPQGGDAALSAALLATFVVVGIGLLPDALLRGLLTIVAP
ncbi:MAG: proton-conducting transporter membrane subunit [Planctomycetaceae bacterium]